MKKVKLSAVLNSEEVNEVQEIFEAWEEILADSIEFDAEYANSDKCKKFKEEIELVKSDAGLDELMLLHVTQDINCHMGVSTNVKYTIVGKLLVYLLNRGILD